MPWVAFNSPLPRDGTQHNYCLEAQGCWWRLSGSFFGCIKLYTTTPPDYGSALFQPNVLYLISGPPNWHIFFLLVTVSYPFTHGLARQFVMFLGRSASPSLIFFSWHSRGYPLISITGIRIAILHESVSAFAIKNLENSLLYQSGFLIGNQYYQPAGINPYDGIDR